ncbi:Gp16 [Ectropis obliqua nucleopolyhedrovirus]|uniref:Gp16 n=1 Tax=Ectropis obliqua nucleopolyhedrovirus TaxID=59376 RepID=A0EZ02_9ABAC|nr:Gp16 [Ectropis obliqua nucleopolyhedrovirus]ABI35782.1 Gp16 [Ectropis obliqua nucleopolyhedrovirus]AGS47945.1 GP16 protein [Ectropis obliqua nucleopolyhedrovirus]QWV59634.1 Gp16 [Ectropis obliqua nucleopolyhedrovirus]UYO72895.1 Gp16 [Ectropis obliqua nucleopolyhedrovirus]
MNYSAICLVIFAAYMWQTGSLSHEIRAVKHLLVVMYDMIESKFSNLHNEISFLKNGTFRLFEQLQNSTKHSIKLIMNNSNKIDVLNNKIDVILHNYEH